MHGGTLFKSQLAIIPSHDLLIAAYSHHLYCFSLTEGTLLSHATNHLHPIISLTQHSDNTALTSITTIDEKGLAVDHQLTKQGRLEQVGNSRKIFGAEELREVRTLVNGKGEQEYYGLTESGRLLRNAEKMTGLISEQCSKILFLTRECLIFRTTDSSLSILNPSTLSQLYQYQHSCQITAVEVYESTLLVGDIKGKISVLNGFLEDGVVKLRQKLQWHVHVITALVVEGAYLYSAGEEGVVVMWHLRENKKDFLPRIGSKIEGVIVHEAKVYCLLADNSIKSIDLGEDKNLVHFKVVLGCRLDNLSQISSEKVKNNLVRVSSLEDRLFMRSTPGKIQEINFGNGLNTEHQIINRNLISRLDSHFPSPHQITDICLSKDANRLVATVEGVNCRSLRFYEADSQGYQLVSKVQNCHTGLEPVQVLSSGDKFVSFSEGDEAIKVWKLMARKKQSILQVEQHFWGCEYEIGYRSKLPKSVSILAERLTVGFAHEFVVFNTQNRSIESVYQSSEDKAILSVFHLTSSGQSQAFLVIYAHSVDLLEFGKQGHTAHNILRLNCLDERGIELTSLSFNQKQQSLAMLVDEGETQSIYVYKLGENVQHFEISKTERCWMTDVFWLGQRVVALDSMFLFYDLTHGKKLVNLSQREGVFQEEETRMAEEPDESGDYQSLYGRYLERQFRRDRAAIQKTSEIFAVAPSITASLDYLSRQLFL